MPVLASQLNPRNDDFKANAQAMQALVDDLRARQAQSALGGGAAAANATPHGASCCRASGWSGFWTPERPSWKSVHWPRWTCTRKRVVKMPPPVPA